MARSMHSVVVVNTVQEHGDVGVEQTVSERREYQSDDIWPGHADRCDGHRGNTLQVAETQRMGHGNSAKSVW